MDRRVKAVYIRQESSSDSPRAPSSPMNKSPLHPRHARAGSTGMPNMKKAQTKAAAQRLAQVMSHQTDDGDDEDELSFDYTPSGFGSIGLAGGRRMRAKSPLNKSPAQFRVPAKTYQTVDEDDDKDDFSLDYSSAKTSLSIGRPGGKAMRARSPVAVHTGQEAVHTGQEAVHTRQEQTSPVPLSLTQPSRPTTPPPPDQPLSARSTISGRTSAAEQPQRGCSPLPARSSTASMEQSLPTLSLMSARSSNVSIEHPLSARPTISGRTSTGEQPQRSRSPLPARSSTASMEQSLPILSPMSARSSNVSIEQPPSARSSFSSRPAIKTVPMSASAPKSQRPVSTVNPSDTAVKRLSIDMGSMNLRNKSNQHSASALQDEIDMLQEENESLLEKLRLAEERFEESDARARQLEKQVASLGEGVTLEAKLLSRKEAALQHREAALKIAEQTSRAALKTEAETAKVEATSALENLHEAMFEVKSLRNITKRTILTQEEMEEVAMKRCWLARYWSLCVQHGIQGEIAEAKYEYWSSLAPVPAEFVLAAGQRANDENSSAISNSEEREAVLQDASDLAEDRNIESLLLVEKGLKELASLKIEDAVAVSMALQRRPNLLKSDEVKLPSEGYEAFELSQEESDDVRFKQAWLLYFWRRAKNHEIEADIAEERLQFWINHSAKFSSSHDAVDVERGLLELRKLGIEDQLWQNFHREPYSDSTPT